MKGSFGRSRLFELKDSALVSKVTLIKSLVS